MADPTLIVSIGAVEFPLAHVSAQEVIKAKQWTGCANRRDWFTAIVNEEPEALLAALVIAKQRAGETVTYSPDVDFNYDDVSAKFVDDQGREVEPVLELKPDGTVRLDDAGKPIPVLDEHGEQQWRDVKTGDVTPFGDLASKKTSATR